LNVSFDAVSEAHLQDLVSTGVPEGVFLEYKRTTYGNGDADVKEYLKDVSLFANTHGGDLVIGIEEKGGLARKVAGVAGVNPDTELQRLESLARDGIEPRIVGLQMKAVSVTGGGIAFVIRVPRSWNPPHRVSARMTNRIYARNSTGAYELSIEELRVLFASGATTIDRMRAFKAERLGGKNGPRRMTKPRTFFYRRRVAYPRFTALKPLGDGDRPEPTAWEVR
jgi:hypothetical protein